MKSTCKPGGCASPGCDGGHYCFRSDGSRIPPLSAEQIGALHKVLGLGPACHPRAGEPHISTGVSGVEDKYQNELEVARKRLERNVGRSYLWNRVILGGTAVLLAILFVAPLVVWYINQPHARY